MPRIRHALGAYTSDVALTAGDPEDPQVDEESTQTESVSRRIHAFEQLRDALGAFVLQHMTAQVGRKKTKTRRRSRQTDKLSEDKTEAKKEDDREGLEDFILYLANEIFENLPTELQATRETAWQDGAETVRELVAITPLSVTESLSTYGVMSAAGSDIETFLTDFYAEYLISLTSPLATDVESGNVSGCELCARDHINLTAHHLIPRVMHTKAVKRGWAADLEECRTRLAWLCRACHSFVHRIAKNEVLAKELNTIEALEVREDVRKWVEWVRRVRWRKR